jgi:RNA polymerase sigma-70 factor (ECF subfamily)
VIQRTETPHDEAALAAFEAERGTLFGIAYRMLGSVHEAEDVLQDAYLRWQGADRAGVERPAAYLVRLVTRLCIDVLRSARARRMEYVGPWLPEPLVEANVDDLSYDAAAHQGLADDLSQAFLLMLERLTPTERAVFLLKESLGFSYRDIAPVVGKTEENCRQIDRRAHQRLAEGGRVRPTEAAVHDRLLRSFLRATREGDVDGLLAVLAADVVSYSDGGGKVTAARRPVEGASNVARFFVGLVSKAPPGTELRIARVNGRPGVLTYVGGVLHNVLTVYVEDDRIRRIFVVVNPDKLPRID